MTWGRPEGMEADSIVAALRPLLPASLPGAPGPFPLSDPDRLSAFVAEAGLTPPPRWSRGTRNGPTLTLPPAYGG